MKRETPRLMVGLAPAMSFVLRRDPSSRPRGLPSGRARRGGLPARGEATGCNLSFTNKALALSRDGKRHDHSLKVPSARPEREPWWDGRRHPVEIGQIEGSGAMSPQVPHLVSRRRTQTHASFHDAAAREAYASHFRPIAFPAVAAGTRSRPDTLTDQRAERRDIPAILRHGFDD